MSKASNKRGVAGGDSSATDASAPGGSADVSTTIQMVKDYARQETIGPLRGAGRWIAFGLAGALTFALATVFLSLGVLRLLQTEGEGTFRGRWMSLIPYLVALLVAALVVGLTLMAMRKDSLHPDKEKP